MARTASFFVAGTPAPKGSKRAFVNKKTGRANVVDDNPSSLRPWAEAVRSEAQRAQERGDRFDSGPIAVTLHFRLRPPQSLQKWRRLPWVRPDVDKLSRAVLDALKGVLYADDGQVCCLIVTRAYALGSPTGARVRIVSLEDVERDGPPMAPTPEEQVVGYAIGAAKGAS